MKTNDTFPASKEYLNAIKVHSKATQSFRVAQNEYRNLKIGDEQFLKAKHEFDVANKAFDVAFTKEGERLESLS